LKCGLKKIEVRKSDKVAVSIPPYDTPSLKHVRKMLLRIMKIIREKTKSEKRKEYLEQKELYVAGGGDAETFKRLKRHGSTWYKRHLDTRIQMLRERKLYDVSAIPVYVVIGEK